MYSFERIPLYRLFVFVILKYFSSYSLALKTSYLNRNVRLWRRFPHAVLRDRPVAELRWRRHVRCLQVHAPADD